MTRFERLALYITLTALTAFAIDALLPVVPLIESDVTNVTALSTAQVFTLFILGMAVGELVIGPLSDAIGRKPTVLVGLAVFTLGTVLAATASAMEWVIAGRLLQGIGVSGPKIGTRAMIRDQYAGTDMAKVMSAIFTLLIFVPMIAPAIGSVIAATFGWRGAFWTYLAHALIAGLWLWRRHPETHLPAHRIPLRIRTLKRNLGQVMTTTEVITVVIATGFVFGSHLTFIAVAAELFGTVYDSFALMPLLLGLLATGTAAALLANMRYVGRTGMEMPILVGLGLIGLAGVTILLSLAGQDHPPALPVFMCSAWIGFFALGLLFGNLNALAMRPLGDMAGLGSSVIASGSSIVAFAFATLLIAVVDHPVATIGSAFAATALLSAPLILIAIRTSRPKPTKENIRNVDPAADV
ncbi:MAG: MFS transporter [Pseudomonadota bacterium]|nr:MFS transporter [Pseudomonadota bacterium]